MGRISRADARIGNGVKAASTALALLVLLAATPALAATAAAPEPMHLLGILLDFILFALTLLGVALFHHHTFAVAMTGLAAITLYRLGFTDFKTGTGLTSSGPSCRHFRRSSRAQRFAELRVRRRVEWRT
jgi:hypothetical protein